MISFIIPTLNEQKAIGRTLDSLSRYSGEHEIVVSDDNSTDGTVEICRRYTDNIVRYTEPEKQTIAQVRNRGAAAARGDYLVFVDADVVIPDINRFFRTAHDVFASPRRPVALTCFYRVRPELRTAADGFVFNVLGLQMFLQNNVFRVGGAGGKFQMVDAEAFRSVRGFNEELVAAEDMELFLRLSRIGRTRFERRLTVLHSGRRAHSIGWPKLLWRWFTNSVSVIVFRRSTSREWEEIR